MPWDKVEVLGTFLKIPASEIQAANFAIRSDFKSFVKVQGGPKPSKKSTPAGLNGIAASAFAATARDEELQRIIQRYTEASPVARKKFVKAAMKMLEN